MKKSLFKLILSTFAVVILFSSCLGDGNNEFGSDSSFAYIKIDQTTGVQCAAVDGIYITSTTIQTLEVGRCYLISYRVSSDNLSSSGIYQNATISSQPSSLTTTIGVVGAASIENTFNPYDFQPYYGSFDSFFGDNWGVVYTAKLKEKDTPRAYFFYDADKQYEMVDGVRKDVEKNQLIIDVRFNYTSGEDGSTIKTGRLTVGNLSIIKNAFQYSGNFEQGSATYADVAIKFRYNQLQSDDTTVKEDVYVGSWTSSLYSFRYYKSE